MNGKRDCKNCIHKVPVFDEEEGIWKGAECDAWECNFVSRAEALKAYEARPRDNYDLGYVQGLEDGRNERPQGECQNCQYLKFTKQFIDGVVEVMDKNGISSVEELQKILQADMRRGEK